MRIDFTKDALKHLNSIKKSGTPAAVRKIKKLLIELAEHPESGEGSPEQLKGELSGLWSRRIDKKNRLIYEIEDDIDTVTVHSLIGHYTDK